MKTGKTGKGYMTTRTQYKDAKKYDHAQFDAFCTAIYKEGFEDGRKSVPGADYENVMQAIGSVKGIGEKRMTQIREAVESAFEMGGEEQ